jgi:hypothetical protein
MITPLWRNSATFDRSTAKILKLNVAQYLELVALGRDIDEEIIVVVVCSIMFGLHREL